MAFHTIFCPTITYLFLIICSFSSFSTKLNWIQVFLPPSKPFTIFFNDSIFEATLKNVWNFLLIPRHFLEQIPITRIIQNLKIISFPSGKFSWKNEQELRRQKVYFFSHEISEQTLGHVPKRICKKLFLKKVMGLTHSGWHWLYPGTIY